MSKSIAILGMGRFGSFLAQELSENGADVLIADSDRQIVNQYAGLCSAALTADLTNPEAIRNLGLDEMDLVVVAMGSSLEASIMCVMVAKEAGVPTVIAKAASERMGEILKRVGADEIIYPEKSSARETARKVLSSNFLEYFHLSGDLCVINMTPKPEWVGKTLSELRLRNRYRVNIVAVREESGQMHVQIDPDRPLTDSMQLLVITETKNLNRLKD